MRLDSVSYCNKLQCLKCTYVVIIRVLLVSPLYFCNTFTAFVADLLLHKITNQRSLVFLQRLSVSHAQFITAILPAPLNFSRKVCSVLDQKSYIGTTSLWSIFTHPYLKLGTQSSTQSWFSKPWRVVFFVHKVIWNLKAIDVKWSDQWQNWDSYGWLIWNKWCPNYSIYDTLN